MIDVSELHNNYQIHEIFAYLRVWISLDCDSELQPLAVPDVQVWLQAGHEAGAAHQRVVGGEGQLLGGRAGAGSAAGVGIGSPVRLHLLLLVRRGKGVFQGRGGDATVGLGVVDLHGRGVDDALRMVNETLV